MMKSRRILDPQCPTGGAEAQGSPKPGARSPLSFSASASREAMAGPTTSIS